MTSRKITVLHLLSMSLIHRYASAPEEFCCWEMLSLLTMDECDLESGVADEISKENSFIIEEGNIPFEYENIFEKNRKLPVPIMPIGEKTKNRGMKTENQRFIQMISQNLCFSFDKRPAMTKPKVDIKTCLGD
ncbi:uncharacterized protein LOC129972490 [Argiope bruennichi]|uniref:uncharacterized protein LOC129972490 n=1 Tax=Argiope bruennichi TaxID=94029 RepID=UPI002494ECB6|nr:uncharacterized protein LOC129972490 [Argiope bruennichi]